MEANVAYGASRPLHIHMARDNMVRRKIFIGEDDIYLDLQRSSGQVLDGNAI